MLGNHDTIVKYNCADRTYKLLTGQRSFQTFEAQLLSSGFRGNETAVGHQEGAGHKSVVSVTLALHAQTTDFRCFRVLPRCLQTTSGPCWCVGPVKHLHSSQAARPQCCHKLISFVTRRGRLDFQQVQRGSLKPVSQLVSCIGLPCHLRCWGHSVLKDAHYMPGIALCHLDEDKMY